MIPVLDTIDRPDHYTQLPPDAQTRYYEEVQRLNDDPDTSKKDGIALRRFMRNHRPPANAAIIYTDGGAKPNPGLGGWGFYAELDNGQCGQACGFAGTEITNNGAELIAATKAIEYAIDTPVKELTLKCDSKYVTESAGKIELWASNGYQKADGSEISNKALWENFAAVSNRWSLDGTRAPIQYEWVKGHSGVMGNEIADTMATSGRVQYRNGFHDDYYLDLDTLENDFGPMNPLLGAKFWYFTTNKTPRLGDLYCYVTISPGKGDKGKKVNDTGTASSVKRSADCQYCIAALPKLDDTLQYLYDAFVRECGDTERPVLVNMDLMRTSTVWPEMVRTKQRFTQVDSVRAILPNKELLANVVSPPKEAFRMTKIAEDLTGVLERGIRGDIVNLDITDRLFTISDKGKVSVHEDVVPAIKYLDIEDVSITDTVKQTIRMSLGIDLPIRNRLSTMSKVVQDKVKVTLLVDAVKDNFYRVYSMVQLDDAYALFATTDSNLRAVKR